LGPAIYFFAWSVLRHLQGQADVIFVFARADHNLREVLAKCTVMPGQPPSASASANSHLVTSGALTVPSLTSFASMSSVASVQSTADRVAALLQEPPQRTLLLGKGQVDAAQLLEIQQHHPHHQLRIEIEPLARHGMQQVRQHLHLLLIFMMLFVQGTNSDVAFHDSAYCRGAQIVLCPLPGNPCSA